MLISNKLLIPLLFCSSIYASQVELAEKGLKDTEAIAKQVALAFVGPNSTFLPEIQKILSAKAAVNPTDASTILQKTQTEINAWVVQSILDENATNSKSAKCQMVQKYVAAGAAVLFPLVVGLVQHYAVSSGSC